MAVAANVLISLLVLQLGWQYLFRFGPDTIGNERVPVYYQNHGLREVVLVATLAVVMLVLTWITPTLLRVTLLSVCGLGVVGSYWIAVGAVGLGRQFEEDASDDLVPHVNHAIQVVIFGAGMVLKWITVTPSAVSV